MFGTKAVEEVRQHKQALVLESSLNRFKLRAELEHLRSAVNPLGSLTGRAQGLFPVLMALAPVAGFFAFRAFRRQDSLPGRLASVARLILPLYRLWRGFSTARGQGRGDTEAGGAPGAAE